MSKELESPNEVEVLDNVEDENKEEAETLHGFGNVEKEKETKVVANVQGKDKGNSKEKRINVKRVKRKPVKKVTEAVQEKEKRKSEKQKEIAPRSSKRARIVKPNENSGFVYFS